MPKIVQVLLLVDSDDEKAIADGLNETLRAAALPADTDNASTKPWLLDWQLGFGGGSLLLRSVSPSVAAAVASGQYEEGTAFQSQAVPLLPGFQYEMVVDDPATVDSLWISVPCKRLPDEGGDLSLLVKRTHEGLIADVTPDSGAGINDSLASLAVGFSDATLADWREAPHDAP